MASQDSKFPAIDFSITSPFRNVRLMEVPDDLLEIITSARKKGGITSLTFKSSPPPTVTTTLSGNFDTSKNKDSVLHLCSEEKSWTIKQVSTSNSIYLIQPLPSTNGRLDTDGDEFMNSDDRSESEAAAQLVNANRGSITAVAQIGSFLELQSVKANEKEIQQNIRDLVSIYEPPSVTEYQLLSRPQLKPSTTKDTLFGNIPAPDNILHQIYSKLCLFELGDQNSQKTVKIPSTSALLHVWSKVVESCAIESIKLDEPIDMEQITQSLDDNIVKTIAEAIFKPGGMLDALDLTEKSGTIRTLKPKETALFIATLILKSQVLNEDEINNANSTPPHLPTQEFIQQWSNLLPTTFVKYCTIDNLTTTNQVTVSNDQDGQEIVMWSVNESTASIATTGPDGGIAKNASAGGENAKIDTKNATVGKRKWHEKFGAQRNVKR